MFSVHSPLALDVLSPCITRNARSPCRIHNCFIQHHSSTPPTRGFQHWVISTTFSWSCMRVKGYPRPAIFLMYSTSSFSSSNISTLGFPLFHDMDIPKKCILNVEQGIPKPWATFLICVPASTACNAASSCFVVHLTIGVRLLPIFFMRGLPGHGLGDARVNPKPMLIPNIEFGDVGIAKGGHLQPLTTFGIWMEDKGWVGSYKTSSASWMVDQPLWSHIFFLIEAPSRTRLGLSMSIPNSS